MGVTLLFSGVAMHSQDDAMAFTSFLDTTKSGIADPIKVKKHFSANEDGLLLLLPPMPSLGVNAWILGSTTKSSSAFFNSMQLCK